MNTRRGLAACLCLCLFPPIAACTPDPEPTGSTAPTTTSLSPEPSTAMERVLEYDFTATGPVAEGSSIADSGPYNLIGVVRLSGRKTMPLEPADGPEPGSTALQFPSPCKPQADGECPKAIIEVPDTPLLNPGASPFNWGATLMMTPPETSTGSNIMQKGFSVGGESQWKLQVDNKAGKPSCLIVGTLPEQKYEATSDISVSDGKWHTLECQRGRQQLRLVVDGKEHAVVAMPRGVKVEPPSAMRIGGKNVKDDNDQFFGALDHVFVDMAAT